MFCRCRQAVAKGLLTCAMCGGMIGETAEAAHEQKPKTVIAFGQPCPSSSPSPHSPEEQQDQLTGGRQTTTTTAGATTAGPPPRPVIVGMGDHYQYPPDGGFVYYGMGR
jgi:hypothetical protein